MKRFVALLMVLMLAAGIVMAEGTQDFTNMVPQNYKDLRDKLYRQLMLSGLRGQAMFTLEGDAEWAAPFRPISGALIDFQTITNDNNGHSELEAKIVKNGQNTAHTRLWCDGENLYLRSSLLIDTVLRYSWKGDFFSSLTAQGTENPNYLSALVNALIHADDWDEITAPLRSELENWLMRYAETPEQITEDGRSLLCIRYRISVNDVKQEMKNLLRIALNNEDLYRQIRLYLTENQLLLGFSAENMAYEDRVIDTLPIADGITVERRVSTMGENVHTEMNLPLAAGVFGWTELSLIEHEGETTVRLGGGENPLAFTFAQTVDTRGSSAWRGTAELTAADGKKLRAAWTADRSFSKVDDENYISREVTILNFKAEPTADSEVAFAPVSLYASLHIYSDYDQRHSTTVEIEVNADVDGEHVNFLAKLMGTKQYDVRDMDVTGAVDALTLTPERRAEIRSDLVLNTMLTLAALDGNGEPETTPEPTEEPTPEPTVTPEPTATPEPEPAETPTPEPTLPTLEEITEVIDLDEEDEP